MNETETWDNAYVPNETEVSSEEFPFIVPEDSSPEEVFKVMPDSKTLLAPRLQSMKNYIAFHYKRSIVKRLNEYLNEKVEKSGKQYSDVANVADLKFGRMDFWGFGKYDLEVHICLEAEINFGSRQKIPRTYYAVLDFDMSECIGLNSIDISEHQKTIQEEDHLWCFSLDQYLIPIMNKSKIEDKSFLFLQYHNYEGWNDQHKNVPGTIVREMGLSTKMLPLHNCKKNKSQLFFKKGTVTVDTDQKDENNKIITKRVDVEADTVVINTNAVHQDYCMLELYHECVHYEWHYMFYMLQDMYTNDLRQIKKTRSVKVEGRKRADALSWLEFQAVHASFAVWMPLSFMKHEIEIRMAQVPNLHPGAKYEYVCKGIAKEYKIPPYRVRARIVRMGQIEARGACNYLDDHFVQPFSFDRKNGSGDYTFFISREQFAKNYKDDKEFRKLIDSRKFMYVDGHVCVNDPSLFYQTSDGPRLVQKVLEHIDHYCLRFIEVYERDEVYTYRFGRLHSDQEFNKHFLYFPPEQSSDHPHLDEVEQQQKNMRYLRKLPRYFPDMLTKLMEDCQVSVEELADRTGMSTRTINRLRNEPRDQYDTNQIIAIIVALHLPPWVSDQVLKATSIDLSGNLGAYPYSYVISCMFMDNYKTVKSHLMTMLGLKNLVLDDPIVEN